MTEHIDLNQALSLLDYRWTKKTIRRWIKDPNNPVKGYKWAGRIFVDPSTLPKIEPVEEKNQQN